MEILQAIRCAGFRQYCISHEAFLRCVFTDMTTSFQKHRFGGGNIVADSGECSAYKLAVITAINNFLNWYNKEN